MISACPICAEPDRRDVRRARVPVNIMTALNGDGLDRVFTDFHLARCPACGHLYNAAFDAAFVDAMYREAPLTNVPTHPSMIDRLRDLTHWLGLDDGRKPDIIEIGAGSGHLARILAGRAETVRVYEPNRSLTPAMLPEPNIDLVTGLFPLNSSVAPADLIICRQVLEHAPEPRRLLAAVAAALKPGGQAYIETPDGAYIERHAAFPDLHLQHVQYFSLHGLIRAAAAEGLRPLRTLSIKDGHDMGVLFVRAGNQPMDIPPHDWAIGLHLEKRLAARIAEARREASAQQGPVALYGATSHGQAWLNAVDEGDLTAFSCVFDDNAGLAERYGLFSPHAAVPVARPTPEALSQNGAIAICAYLHTAAITTRLRERGYSGRIITQNHTQIAEGDS